MTVAMLAVLLSLGFWQIERLAWKTALLADIDRAEASVPAPLTDHPAPFAKVRVKGRFVTDARGLYGAAVHDSGPGPLMGADLLMPLRREGGGRPVLIDRGWVPQTRDQALPLADKPVTIDGFVRPRVKPGVFSPHDDLAARHFYTLDPIAIGSALGVPDVAPFTLVALGTPDAGTSYPDPARHLPRPDNNHLSYAITWFGLAGALVVIFAVWAGKVLRP